MPYRFVLRTFLLFVMTFLSALALSSGNALAAKPQPLTFDGSVTIVESADEPAPVQRATEDLLNDFAKVFGKTPERANDLENAGPVAVLIADKSRVHEGLRCTIPQGTESFAFSVQRVAGQQPLKHLVCLTGADMRGTIFAIYQFSQ